MSVSVRPFGISPDGKPVHSYLISLESGESVEVLDFGATLRGISVYDGAGKLGDVCLGLNSADVYASAHGGSMGGIISRVGNRIRDGKFVLNGVTYQMGKNNNGNNLHSGPFGHHLRMWTAAYRAGDNQVTFVLYSPSGDQGFPGNAHISVCYSLEKAADEVVLGIQYKAVSDADTLFNMTNHAYFNLAGGGDVREHTLFIDSDTVTETDDALIPNGKFISAASAGLDFSVPRKVGTVLDRMEEYPVLKNAGGLDANFVLKTPGGKMRRIAELSEDSSRRVMSVYTDQPGVQCYSGQGLNVEGKNGAHYDAYYGICLETQHYPDSVNHPEFPSVVSKANEIYETRTEYRFSVR